MIDEDEHALIHKDAATGTQWRLIEADSGALSLFARLDVEEDAYALADELDDLLEYTSRSPDDITHVVTRAPMDIFTTRADREDDPAIRWVIGQGRSGEIEYDLQDDIHIINESGGCIDDYPTFKALYAQ